MGFHHGNELLVMCSVNLVLRGSKPWALRLVMALIMPTIVSNYYLLRTLHALASLTLVILVLAGYMAVYLETVFPFSLILQLDVAI